MMPQAQWEDPETAAHYRRVRNEQRARDLQAKWDAWEREHTPMCLCGRSLLPSMRFCDACGRPLSYTGQTVRLGCGTE